MALSGKSVDRIMRSTRNFAIVLPPGENIVFEIIDSTNEGSRDDYGGLGLFNHSGPWNGVPGCQLTPIIDGSFLIAFGEIPQTGTLPLECLCSILRSAGDLP